MSTSEEESVPQRAREYSEKWEPYNIVPTSPIDSTSRIDGADYDVGHVDVLD